LIRKNKISHCEFIPIPVLPKHTPQIYLAPFQGITGQVYRLQFVKHFGGISKMFTPFFTGIHENTRFSKRQLFELGSPQTDNIRLIPQILSKDGAEIQRFANLCRQIGYNEINWNLGCPYPQVANKKRGSGLLPYPEMIKAILDQVYTSDEVKLSVKCRLGYFSVNEIFDVLPVLQAYPLTELIVHARFGKQLYSGSTDEETFAKLLSISHLSVVYNGDIFSADDYQRMSGKFAAVNNWMVGRGILSDPFLAETILNSLGETKKQQRIQHFIDDVYYTYHQHLNSSLAILGIMKELWRYLSISFDEPQQVFRLLKKVNSFDEYESAVSEVFRNYQWKHL
jgi:tRNA-dihydrouridine synthase